MINEQNLNTLYNSDEKLFSDNQRPRDELGFKIKPWEQIWKRDWRGTNKNICFSHVMIKWWSIVPWSQAGKSIIRVVPKLQKERTEKERYTWFPYWVGVDINYTKMEKINNPFVMVKEWPISYRTGDWGTWQKKETTNTCYFEIMSEWLYYVMCYGVFYFDINYYDSNESYKYKQRVWLGQKDSNWVFFNTDRIQARACGNGDVLRFMQISFFPKWSQLLPMVWHSFLSGTNSVFGAINLVRLQ